MDIITLCDQVRETAYAIHAYHGNGFLEKIYENALVHRLLKAGINVKQQQPVKVYDEDGTEIGHYCADILVEECLILELKACRNITDEHRAQLFNYLKACQIDHGMLINFGSYKFQIKKLIYNQR